MRASRSGPARLITAALLIAVALLVRVWLSGHDSLLFDRSLFARFAPTGTTQPAVFEIEQFLNLLGTAPLAAITVITAVLVAARRLGLRAAAEIGLSVGVVLLTAALKAAWGPTHLWAQLRPHHGSNYPSGHTAYATSVFGELALLARRHRQPELAVVCGLVILAMGPALVLYGAHLPADVIGGYLLGAAWLILVSLWSDQAGAKNGADT
jgi:membrane-associated phospholipid phosphatase